jgi:hypothetical protein
MNTSPLGEESAASNPIEAISIIQAIPERGGAGKISETTSRTEAIVSSTKKNVPESVSMERGAFQPGPERFETRLKSDEDAARESLESLAGRTLTAAQWTSARARLLEFVGILLDCERTTTTSEAVLLGRKEQSL